GDVMLRPGKADVGVLRLAGRRVERLRVGKMASLELDGLFARRSPESAEDHAERVERGRERAERARQPQNAEAATPFGRGGEDVVLGEVAGEAGKGGERERRDQE